MKSRMWVAVAVFVLGAGRLGAQATPFQEYFKLEGTLPNDPTITYNRGDGTGNHNAKASPYEGGLATLSSPTNFADFLVYCVDELHSSTIGQSYKAWITPLTAVDYSHTRLGLVDKDEYIWAAYLASAMNLNWSTSVARSQTVALQDAMWALLGEGYHAAQRLTAFENTALAHTLGISTTTNFATTVPLNFDASQWALITCVPGWNLPVSSCTGQEFLVKLPTGTVTATLTPEPGSMSLMGTGLVSVLGFGWRKRKRNNKS